MVLNIISTSITVLMFISSTLAQAPVRKLPSNINRASVSLFSPYISGDGETLVFLSNYSDDGHYRMRWVKKLTASTWSDPIEISRQIDQPTLTFKGGHSLSFDGDLLLLLIDLDASIFLDI